MTGMTIRKSRRHIALILVLLTCLWTAGGALALGVDAPLPDPAAEARVQEIANSLRCLVCQNQTIAESDADLARDLRGIIREQIAEGADDGQIRGYLVSRYGEWILMRPPFNWRNALLWTAPALLLLAGIAVIARNRRRARDAAPAARPLDAAEEARLAALLERDR